MTRREFLRYLSVATGALLPWAVPGAAAAMGEKSKVCFTSLKLGKGWDCRSGAARGLLYEVDQRTSVQVDFEPTQVVAQDKKLFDHPLLFLSGDQSFTLPPRLDLEKLASFLRYGGMLVIDSATGEKDDGFDKSARQMIQTLFPNKKLEKISYESTLFKAFYRIDRVAGRLAGPSHFEGVILEDRVALLYSTVDLHGAWAISRLGQWRYQPVPGGDTQRRLAIAIGVNIFLYALTVNYKSDQVHTTYQLKRRRLW